jgi:uncharacterized phage-associated protein
VTVPTKTYDAREIANFILDRSDLLRRDISNLSLQKIVYFCHVWVLAALERPLVREQFEAWEFGPVLPYLYREFRDCGDRKITKRASKLDKETGQKVQATYSFEPDVAALLTDVIDTYSALTPYQLVQISHAKGSPWDQAWNHEEKINVGMRISNELIADFYSAKSRPNAIQ